MKTATVQARIEPQLKKNVEAILASLGLSASEAIAMYYRQIEHHEGLPFKVKVPNKKLRKALEDSSAGRGFSGSMTMDEFRAQYSKKH